MRIEEAVECMSKINLHRILDSYTKDTLKPDEVTSRKRIVTDLDILSDSENIKQRMQFTGSSFESKAVAYFLLEALISADQNKLDEQSIISYIIDYEKKIIEEALKPDVFKFKNDDAVNIYKTVLEVALEDDVISDDEKRLLDRLRRHVGLSFYDHHLIQAALNKFPKAGNEIHTEREIKSGLVDLQRRGVVFYCNQCPGGPVYLIPEELIAGVKNVLGIELSNEAYTLLLDRLSNDALWTILNANKLPVSGKKTDKIERIRMANIQPSAALNTLSNEELYELCKKLPGVNVSGSKGTRIDNIINHFDKLRIVIRDEVADKREQLYEYYVELATRDRENLLSNKVISKDKDMDSAFEEATRYLFEKKLGLALEPMPGSEHADGILRFPKSNDLFMWDTKSKESIYEFPNDHFNQFRRYIHNSNERVSCFMVIAPLISDKAEENAYRLKAQSGTDTDLSMISAKDLKWVAENWKSYSQSGKFHLDVFNFTGILDGTVLRKRMKIFLK
jgi:hypothetical protein